MATVNTEIHPVKIAIFGQVRQKYEQHSGLDNVELNKLLFHTPGSLRLSLTGFVNCKNIFTAYSFEISVNIASRHRIALSRLEFPYYITGKRLILFSEMDAAMIKLCGSVEQFLETYSSVKI
jgi:hypothetical protein